MNTEPEYTVGEVVALRESPHQIGVITNIYNRQGVFEYTMVEGYDGTETKYIKQKELSLSTQKEYEQSKQLYHAVKPFAELLAKRLFDNGQVAYGALWGKSYYFEMMVSLLMRYRWTDLMLGNGGYNAVSDSIEDYHNTLEMEE